MPQGRWGGLKPGVQWALCRGRAVSKGCRLAELPEEKQDCVLAPSFKPVLRPPQVGLPAGSADRGRPSRLQGGNCLNHRCEPSHGARVATWACTAGANLQAASRALAWAQPTTELMFGSQGRSEPPSVRSGRLLIVM